MQQKEGGGPNSHRVRQASTLARRWRHCTGDDRDGHSCEGRSVERESTFYTLTVRNRTPSFLTLRPCPILPNDRPFPF
jgi:hypothetical protein